jgi:hypothetical protein
LSFIRDTGNEEDTGLSPVGEQLVVIVTPIHGDNRTGWKRNFSGNGNIVFLSVGDVGIGREVALMIQQKVELDGSLGAPKLGPGEKRQTQRDGHAIQGKQLVLEAGLPVLGCGGLA